MPQSNLDAETQKVLREADALQEMFATSGWGVAERVFNEYIDTLDKVSTIDTSKDINQQLRDRINVVASLRAILDDIKGRVSNAQHFAQSQTTKSVLIERR
jgi:hypothetical protein